MICFFSDKSVTGRLSIDLDFTRRTDISRDLLMMVLEAGAQRSHGASRTAQSASSSEKWNGSKRDAGRKYRRRRHRPASSIRGARLLRTLRGARPGAEFLLEFLQFFAVDVADDPEFQSVG
jgi:hypothetical protein